MEPYYEDNEHFMALFNTKVYEETTISSLSPSQPQQTEPNNSNHSLSPSNLNFLQTGSPSSLSPGNQSEMNLFEPNLGTTQAQSHLFSTNDYSQLTCNFQKSLLPDYPIKQEHFDLFQTNHNQQIFGTDFSNTAELDLISSHLGAKPVANDSQLDLSTPAYTQVVTPLTSQEEPTKGRGKRGRKKKQVLEEVKVVCPGMPILAPRPVFVSPEMHIPFKIEPAPIVASQLEVSPLYNQVARRLSVEPKRSSESAEAYRSRTLQKKSERLIRNRHSAMISRQKKKEYLTNLESDNKQLNHTNLVLLERISQLESMIQEMAHKLPNPDIYLSHLDSIRVYPDETMGEEQMSNFINFPEDEQKGQNVRNFNAVFPFLFLILFLVLGWFRFEPYGKEHSLSSFASSPVPSHTKVAQAQIAPAIPSVDQTAYRHTFTKVTNRKMVEKALESKRPHVKEGSLSTLRQFAVRSVRSNDQRLAKVKTGSVLDVQLPIKPKRAFVYTANLRSWLPSPSSTSPTTYPPSVSETLRSLQQQSILTLITDWVGEDSEELYQDKFLMLDLKVCSAAIVDSKSIERFN